MTDDAAKLIALRHYRTLWYGQTWAAIAEAWQTEYDSVSAGTFKSIEMISSSFESTSHSARKNFEQAVRTAALQDFRCEQDADYAAAIEAPPRDVAAGPTVTYPIFGPGAFHH